MNWRAGLQQDTQHAAQRLGRAKNPRGYELVDHPLRDDAGKVRRSELAAARSSPLAG